MNSIFKAIGVALNVTINKELYTNVNTVELVINGEKVQSYAGSDLQIKVVGNVESLETVNGDVEVSGSASNINTVNGDVNIESASPNVSVNTVNGDVSIG